ncbi:hypothetical protein BDF21DRAFT_395519 [Thamnidium elegans]|nr:hypothetical protein BDF21DRAFT_395519 [Thamnidium elegans]
MLTYLFHLEEVNVGGERGERGEDIVPSGREGGEEVFALDRDGEGGGERQTSPNLSLRRKGHFPYLPYPLAVGFFLLFYSAKMKLKACKSCFVPNAQIKLEGSSLIRKTDVEVHNIVLALNPIGLQHVCKHTASGICNDALSFLDEEFRRKKARLNNLNKKSPRDGRGTGELTL